MYLTKLAQATAEDDMCLEGRPTTNFAQKLLEVAIREIREIYVLPSK